MFAFMTHFKYMLFVLPSCLLLSDAIHHAESIVTIHRGKAASLSHQKAPHLMIPCMITAFFLHIGRLRATIHEELENSINSHI